MHIFSGVNSYARRSALTQRHFSACQDHETRQPSTSTWISLPQTPGRVRKSAGRRTSAPVASCSRTAPAPAGPGLPRAPPSNSCSMMRRAQTPSSTSSCRVYTAGCALPILMHCAQPLLRRWQEKCRGYVSMCWGNGVKHVMSTSGTGCQLHGVTPALPMGIVQAKVSDLPACRKQMGQ